MDQTAQSPTPDSRRAFIEKVGSAVFAGLVLGGTKLVGGEPAPAAPELPLMPESPFKLSEPADQDVLIRMQAELQRAMKKAPKDRRWGMVIDTKKLNTPEAIAEIKHMMVERAV